MLDIKFVRENPEAVKENIRKKFQNAKLPLVDEAIALDAERRQAIADGEALKAERNKLSKANGPLFGRLKKCTDEAEKASIQAEIDANNAAVKADAERMAQLEAKKEHAESALNKIMLVIPQMIDPSVPIGPDDSCNVEVQRFGEPKTPDFEVPYHTDIMERFDGIDMDAAARVSGSGFYYLLGDVARLHEAVLAYARDFMIGKGFTYCIPPFMIHGNVVEGVMSQTDMDAMMYKIEGEDLYLIGTSEHSMIGKFIDQILPEDKLPQTLTSYSPCFRKEKGAHGIEERGVYRIHQFEKQEMIVVCKPEDSKKWYEQMWQYSVELFRSLDIPVRLHEAVLAYARDFMIGKGFTYCIPPFMIHGNVVEGVMSQTDMDAMMYKIEGEDLYLIGTSEHSMIGKFIDQILPEDKLPQTLTSYSPCFRKEKGAHGIEERGVYRIHQFEKQEMIVVCKPEDSKKWYEQMWQYSVELFRSLDIPVRQLECCSGDLADLKCKSCDIEAWSPRQQKYFEVCSCSNLGDAQARRLKIRYKDADGKMQLCHTLNNTVVAPPRMLIALLENNLQADGSVLVPKALQPYMGGKDRLVPRH